MGHASFSSTWVSRLADWAWREETKKISRCGSVLGQELLRFMGNEGPQSLILWFTAGSIKTNTNAVANVEFLITVTTAVINNYHKGASPITNTCGIVTAGGRKSHTPK